MALRYEARISDSSGLLGVLVGLRGGGGLAKAHAPTVERLDAVTVGAGMALRACRSDPTTARANADCGGKPGVSAAKLFLCELAAIEWHRGHGGDAFSTELGTGVAAGLQHVEERKAACGRGLLA